MANPTSDSQMNYYLAQIAEAKKGKDVRSAIYGGLERTFNKSYEWADAANTHANEALANSSEALATVSGISEDIDEAVEKAEHADTSYNEISARVDEIIAHNQDTTSNTELIDIRTGYNGYRAATAGTSVRKQVSDLHSQLNNIVLNNPRSSVAVDVPAEVRHVELWANSDASSAFAGQSITFTPVNGTVGYLIEFKETASSVTTLGDMAGANLTKRISIGVNGSYGIAWAKRDFTFSNGSVTISDCQQIAPNNPFSLSGTDMTIVDPSASLITANNYLIPVKIYAVQSVLAGTLQVSKDTEVVDARTGVDGVTYNTLGEAIRTQISEYIAEGVLDALNGTY